MTIRPVPLRTKADVMALRGVVREEHEVRCDSCGKFMSAVVTIIHYDEGMVEAKGLSFDRYMKDIHMEIKVGALGKCARCKEDNAQILYQS